MTGVEASPTVRRVNSGSGRSWSHGPPGWEERREWWEKRRERRGPRPFFAVLVGVVQVVGVRLAARGQSDATALDALGYTLLLAGPAALIVRRRWPLFTLAIALAAAVMYALAGYPGGPFFVAALIALFSAVRRAPRAAVWACCATAYGAYVGLGLLAPSDGFFRVGDIQITRPSLGEAIAVGAFVAIAVALAEAGRVRSLHFAEMARTQAEAARARSEQSRRQASEERLRIARELHDVLGHHLSLINVRAGVALHLLDSQPEQANQQAREALGAIKLASAEALREVRGVLATLHPLDESAPRSPAPGLDEARSAGLSVTVEEDGDVRALAPEVDRAAYRIIQEGLTNVRRHAGAAATASITIGYGPERLTIRIDDTGTGPPSTPDQSGNGIPGMRARAEALGGTLTVGAWAGGGFQVEATLPIGPEGAG
jgi:signal transduction histidine kinase